MLSWRRSFRSGVSSSIGLERPEVLPSAARLEMFVRQLRGSALLKYDMDVYKRTEDPDTARAYETLVRNVERIIREQRTLKVQSQLGQGGQPPPALAAPAGTGCRFFNTCPFYTPPHPPH